MASITLAMSDDEHPVPGIDCALAAGLFVMHAPAVRNWIAEQRAAAGNHGLIVMADDEWVNPGGYQSLTVAASQLDVDALDSIRESFAKRRPSGEVSGGQ
jgi:hypothetical protein